MAMSVAGPAPLSCGLGARLGPIPEVSVAIVVRYHWNADGSDHAFDLVRIGDVGALIHDADIVLSLEIIDDFFDFVGRPKAVEDDIGALSGERCRDPKSDSTGRAGHNGGFACPHLISP